MQQVPQASYLDERLKTFEGKLDNANTTLNNLASDVRVMNQRVTSLENAPKEAQARLTLWLLGGGCLYMLLSVCVTVIGIAVTYLVTHH